MLPMHVVLYEEVDGCIIHLAVHAVEEAEQVAFGVVFADAGLH